MDKANIQNECYPKHMLRVQLSELDFDCFKPRRFDIRTPPTDQHLSTAESVAFVLSKIEEDHSHIIYDTIMKPLDLMVQQWHSFSDHATANRNKKRQADAQKGDASADQHDKRSRALGLVDGSGN